MKTILHHAPLPQQIPAIFRIFGYRATSFFKRLAAKEYILIRFQLYQNYKNKAKRYIIYDLRLFIVAFWYITMLLANGSTARYHGRNTRIRKKEYVQPMRPKPKSNSRESTKAKVTKSESRIKEIKNGGNAKRRVVGRCRTANRKE